MKSALRSTVLFALFLAVGAVFAQKAATPPPPTPAAAAAAAPQLTDVQRLTLENLQLKATLLQQQQRELQQQFTSLLQGIQQTHPGWVFNPNTQQFTPAPKPASPAPRAKR